MRWRDIKHGKKKPQKELKKTFISNTAPAIMRIKAFIVDVFMIYIPILYITTYLILDGKDDFLQNQMAIFIDTALFGLILTIFLAKNGQSPGYKAYSLYAIDTRTKEKVLFVRALFRYICFLFSGATFVGLFIFIFRKDKMHLHDILSNTTIIHKP